MVSSHIEASRKLLAGLRRPLVLLTLHAPVRPKVGTGGSLNCPSDLASHTPMTKRADIGMTVLNAQCTVHMAEHLRSTKPYAMS